MGGQFVNKKVVDNDRLKSNKVENRDIEFFVYTGIDLSGRDLRKLTEVIYKNFQILNNVQGLDHNRREILRLLTSPGSYVIIGLHKRVIVSYLIAETTEYNTHKLMHIYYLYTSAYYRGHGIASYMLGIIENISKKRDIDMVSLTYDTNDTCLLYTSPSPRDMSASRMPSSA